MLAAPPVGSVIPPATDEILAAQLAALERNRKELEKSDNFRRKTSESSSITGASLSERESLGALAPIRVPYTAYRASPKSSVKVRPRGFASPEKTLTPVLSRLGNGGKPMATPDTMAASSATRLIINPSPKPKLKFSLQADQSKPSPLKITAADSVLALQHGFGQAPTPTTPTTPASPRHLQTPNGVTNKGYDYYQQVIGSPGDEASATCSAKNGNVAPTLTKVGYSCSPPIDFLYTLPAEDLAAVPNFSIERHGVGKIEWEGAVDIRGIDLDQVVVIEPKSASVYTKEEEENRKPSVGTKLNRAAIITLEGVYAPEATFESQEKFTKKVERQTTKMGAQLIDYDVTTGIWKLRVQHFSRYALDDDDDDSSSERKSGEENTKVHFQSGEREGRSRAMEEGNRIQRQSTPYKAPRVLTSVAVVVEDDDMDSGSDMEITEESKVLLEAEAAFAALQNTMTEQTFSRRKRQDESAHFVEEQKPALQSVASSRYVPTVEDIQAAQSKGSVCIRMATKAGIETSSIDFGKRLGRSFRVGWSPDGSFFCPNKDGNLVRRRPKFSAGALSIGCCLFYLEQHRANAMNVGNEKSCPEFALPSGDSLASVLSSYAEHTSFSKDGVASIAKQSFSLLKYFSMGIPVSLTETSGTAVEGLANEESLELRRLFAIHQWLKDSCSDEVEIEVKTALTFKDNHKALLAAISGGDSEKACKVADELEFYQLALMLAAGPEGKADILSEVMAWTDSGAASKMPDDLIRSYFLLGGDLKMEEDIFRRKHSPFDWRRRLVMSLTYGSKSTKQSVSFLVDDYNEKVAQGFAPFPRPHYLSRNDAAKIECVCYRLLHLGNHASGSLLRDIIDPRGYTYSLHDFSLSFHLAAAISAIGCSAPLSQVEEMTLIHGYAAQLLAAGMWEWAVYVLMCRLGQVSQSVSRWKQQRAKDLVLQNYRSVTIDRRTFLENVGVPSVWFDEALALQCATNGDAVGYLSYMVKVDPDEACASLEYTLIPNMFFMNKDDLGEARMVLDAFSVDSNSLAGAVVDFFHLYEDILLLEEATSADVDAAISPMLDRCEQVEQVFASYRSGQAKLRGPTLRIFPAAKTVPMASFLAEGLSQISLFKLQLRALQLHLSLSSTATQLLNLSQPNGMMDSGLSARENILRWLL